MSKQTLRIVIQYLYSHASHVTNNKKNRQLNANLFAIQSVPMSPGVPVVTEMQMTTGAKVPNSFSFLRRPLFPHPPPFLCSLAWNILAWIESCTNLCHKLVFVTSKILYTFTCTYTQTLARVTHARCSCFPRWDYGACSALWVLRVFSSRMLTTPWDSGQWPTDVCAPWVLWFSSSICPWSDVMWYHDFRRVSTVVLKHFTCELALWKKSQSVDQDLWYFKKAVCLG